MRYRAKQRIFNEGISNCQDAHNKMFNILSHQKNLNQNYPEILPYTNQNGSKPQERIHADVDVGKEEHSSTASGLAEWYKPDMPKLKNVNGK